MNCKNLEVLEKIQQLSIDHNVYPDELLKLPCISVIKDNDGIITDIKYINDNINNSQVIY